MGLEGKPIPGSRPAEVKRVTENIVLEKRMWYPVPWALKQAIYDVVEEERTFEPEYQSVHEKFLSSRS